MSDLMFKFRSENFPMNALAACSGVAGSNAQAACINFFPDGRILYRDSFRAVFEALASGQCNYGVLPIENSFNGSVRAVYDLVIEYRFFIVRSLLLPIRHDLLAKPGTHLEDITSVYSHSQALGQCSKFLEKLGAKSIPFWNTAGAAEMVSKSSEQGIAAIASPLCSGLYGLECLASSIQDNSSNYTKFICVFREPVIYPEADHMSLIVSCENVPGALNAVLSKISSHGINMNKLESCPKSGAKFEYIFFLELEASLTDDKTGSMLHEIQDCCTDCILLGNYRQI